MFAKVVGEPDLVRDQNGVIHNRNNDDYRAFLAKRQAAQTTTQRIDNLERQVQEQNEKLDLILNLLRDKK